MNTDPCSSVFICGFAFGCGSYCVVEFVARFSVHGNHNCRGGARVTILAVQYLFVFLLLPASSAAQAGVTVSGMVEDQSGAVIPGAEVSLVQGQTARTTSTDEQGRFM